MNIFRAFLIAFLAGAVPVSAQAVAGAPIQATQAYGSVDIRGQQAKAGLARKRFYLFSGGAKDNAALIERIKSTQVTSRDCYYANLGVSACFIDWLRQKNCDTPFCRQIEQADVTNIPEFRAAYDKGLPLYGRKPNIALEWVANNLPENIAIGFYRQQKSGLEQILKGVRPVESAIATAAAAQALFANIPVGAGPVPVLFSNVLPVEMGGKSYVWICEANVVANKPTVLALRPDPKNQSKGCTLEVKDIKTCSTGTCEKK